MNNDRHLSTGAWHLFHLASISITHAVVERLIKRTMNDNPPESGRKRPHQENDTPSKKVYAAEREFILNADGTVLHDHKGVSFTLCFVSELFKSIYSICLCNCCVVHCVPSIFLRLLSPLINFSAPNHYGT
jgi:hypothetical protein